MNAVAKNEIISNSNGSEKTSLIRFKKIVLQGFKSFPEQTELLFNDNICAIVGPNGCGKSNILDALRWVLGEQGPSQLRARAMSDVIFNGTANRKPVGMAEITLVIECSPGSLPVSYEDVAITRRLYRSGDSEYLLNKTPCRLKDITDLFLDTGIGKGAYSLIEQGRVDALVTARPDERRGFLEQIAGIEKYKVRKKEALSRLTTTETNLARVRDVISEVKSRRISLARQARKAAKYRSVISEIDAIQRLLAGGRCAKIQARLKILTSKIAEIENASAHNSAKQALLSVTLNESSKQTDSAQSKLKQTVEEFARIETSIDTLETRANDIDARRSERESDIQRETEDAKKLEAQKKSLENRKECLHEESSNLKQLHDNLERSIAHLNQKHQNADNTVQQLRSKITTAQSNRLKEITERSDLDHRIKSTEERLVSLDQRIHHLNKEAESILADQCESEKKHSELLSRTLSLQTESNTLTSQIDTMKKVRAELTQQQNTAVANQREIEKHRLSLESRMESLKEMAVAGEGLDDGVRQTLNQFDRYRKNDLQSKIYGTVADLYDTDDEYEEAVVAGLYPHLQDIVVSSQSLSDEICLFLIGKKPGRTSIRQLPDMSEAVSTTQTVVRNKPSEMTSLKDLVTTQSEFVPLFEELLANVFLAPDVASASKMAKNNPDSVIVTRCGQRWGSGKVRIIGRTVDNRPAFRRRKKEIQALKTKLVQCRDREQNAVLELEKINSLSHEKEQEWTVIQDTATSKNQMLAVIRGELEHISTLLDQTKSRYETVIPEIQALQQEKDALTKQLHQNRLQQTKMKEQPGFVQEIETLENQLKRIESERDSSREKLTELRIQLRSARDRSEFVERENKRLEEEIKRLDHLSDQHRLQAQKNRELLESDSERRRELMNTLRDNLEKCPVYRHRIETLKSQLEQFQRAHKELVDESVTLEKADRNLEREMAEVRIEKASLEAALSALREDASCDPEIEAEELGRVPEDQEIADWKNQFESLQTTLALFSDVNLAAEQEHRELMERFHFLDEQLRDMEHAIQSLRSTIQQINRTSKTRFIDALNAVNTHFGEIFQGLFGGGEASLELSDPNDPLESGVDIICKPPGKRARTIDLLSGGEKALAALALLLAGFKYRPSPLLFLDEVDAPLDENNVARFTTFLRTLSQMTQVVMITHNPLTMEIADLLYGVTMEEPGISKLVSARLGVFSA